MSLQDEMFRVMMTNNMNQIVMFHNHLMGSVKSSLNNIPELEWVDEFDKGYWSHVYENEFPRKLRKTCFLLMFGHLEEILLLLYEEDAEKPVMLGRGSGINKHKPHISYCLGSDLGSSEDYLYIINAQEVRNCLLHAAGRVSMMSNAEKLKGIINSSGGDFFVKNDRVEVSENALVNLQVSINQLLISMHESIAGKG